MSIPISINWPIPNVAAICALQDTAGAANLLINGSLASGITNPTVTFNGFSRKVSLTSANNLSGINFTINGQLNGQAISETLVGPNANTVATTNNFDAIFSIHVNGAVTQVSVGTGTTGQIHWIKHNTHTTVAQIAIGATVVGTINYSYQISLEDVTTISSPNVFGPIPAMTGATTTQFSVTSLIVANYSRILINSSGANGALTFDFIQQGILG